MTLRIANAAGFWGDRIDAPRRLLEAAEVDYLTLEYLAELTMSILAHRRKMSNTNLGFATDFVEVARSIAPAIQSQDRLKIVTNAGGLTPMACAGAVAEEIVAADLSDVSIAVIRGDDLLERLQSLQADGCDFANLDSSAPLAELKQTVVCANAYLGAAPIVEALAGAARIVITGRVADASLTVGPAVHEFDWDWNDWDRLAAASVAGHTIECGAQATGGYSTHWRSCDLADVGYPIAEIDEDGGVVITKPDGTGGAVDRHTVTEQLVYEIGDPAHYLTPDVDVDFTSLAVAEVGPDRVAIRGARGRSAPDHYKVSLAYEDGYMVSGQLLVFGRDCVEKAHEAADIVRSRLKRMGIHLEGFNVEIFGTGASVPRVGNPADDLREVVMRVTARDARAESLQEFSRQFAPLITSGPAGIAGYAQARPRVRNVYSYWPTLVPKSAVLPSVLVRPAKDWVR